MKLIRMIAAVSVLAAGCAHSTDVAVPSSAPSPRSESPRTHENLDATLYLQTAVEYDAIAIQTFRMARELASEGLEDPSWNAIDDRQGSDLPPAVIVDVDETVLDNSPYQARLILDDEEFGRESWKAWVDQAAAHPIPGAVEFARWAEANGITMFYVTNRRDYEEEPTRRNLAAAGFPIRDDLDTVLTRDERPEWGSDKTTRRAHVARDFRVLLLIGDDFGDFVPRTWSDVESRHDMLVANQDRWGRQWLVLPNPTYGSWMSAVLHGSDPETTEERLEILYEALDPER